MKLGRT
jgi:hypothetical protein